MFFVVIMGLQSADKRRARFHSDMPGTVGGPAARPNSRAQKPLGVITASTPTVRDTLNTCWRCCGASDVKRPPQDHAQRQQMRQIGAV